VMPLATNGVGRFGVPSGFAGSRSDEGGSRFACSASDSDAGVSFGYCRVLSLMAPLLETNHQVQLALHHALRLSPVSWLLSPAT
jgi:hypothetical protein